MGDLRNLVEAVEAGRDHSEKWHPALGEHGYTAMMAFHDDLNAANALHDALVPGWGYLISKHDAEIWREGEYPNTIAAQVKDNPARAWLLTILRAMEAEGRNA